VLAAVLLNTAFQVAAAEAPSFYPTMLQRGLATYAKGDYAKAYSQLRIAAFGLVEDIPQYEMAEVHVILAADKLHHLDDARLAARRFAAAERIEPAYASLHLDSAMRHDFEALLPSLLAPRQLALLPSFSPIVLHGSKNPSEIVALYSEVRTLRRLTSEETVSLFNALVQSGRTADAAGMRGLLTPAEMSNPAIASALAKVPAPATNGTPMASSAGGGGNDVTAQLRDAEKAIGEARFGAARQIYLRLSRQSSLPRATSLEIARGLHRTSALKESSALYQKLYPLQHGEEQHMLAESVNRYELGDLATARVLLGRSLSGVSRTPELSLYLPRIESAH
jgi:hypothetical protein